MARAQVREPLTLAQPQLAPRSALRVRPQRPARALAGALLVVASMVAALTVYSRIGDRHEVLVLARTVLAGDRLVDADFKVVAISSDDSLTTVPASARESLVGQYAKVRMLAGSLVVGDSVHPLPLVDRAKVVMWVAVPVSGVPSGLREGSRLVLIVTPATPSAAPVLVEATVAAVPRDLADQ